MPYTVKIDLNTTRLQQVVIQDASPRATGVMTKLQVQQLEDLVEHGVSEAMVWTVTGVKAHDYFADFNEFVPVNAVETAVVITLPQSNADNVGQVIAVKAVGVAAPDLDIQADGGQLIDGQVDYIFDPAQRNTCVVFVSNGTGWDIGYWYKGSN